MTQTYFFRRVKRLRNESRPLQVLLNDQTLACFLSGTNTLLDISDVAHLLDFSGRSNHNPTQNSPVLSPENPENGLVTLGNHASVRYPSAFFQSVLQTNKPAMVAMIRCLAQQVLPKTAVLKAPLATVTDDAKVKRLLGSVPCCSSYCK